MIDIFPFIDFSLDSNRKDVAKENNVYLEIAKYLMGIYMHGKLWVYSKIWDEGRFLKAKMSIFRILKQ